MREEEKLARFNELVDRIETSINKLIELVAMRTANEERMQKGESLAYGEEEFINLLKNDGNI